MHMENLGAAGNTYAFFAMQKSELEPMAVARAAGRSGARGIRSRNKPARNLIKKALTQSHDLFWRGADADPTQLKVDVDLNRWRPVACALSALDPKSPAQKDALAELMEQTRLLMSLQLSSPVAWSLVTSVIPWSMFLFCGLGVLSGINPTTIVPA
jgi:hypothetical protein